MSIYGAVGGVIREMSGVPVAVGGVTRESISGVGGVGGIVREFFCGYKSLMDAYEKGAWSYCVATFDYEKDDGEKWKQYAYACSYIPSGQNTLADDDVLYSDNWTPSSDHLYRGDTIYFFCDSLKNAQKVAEFISENYTTIKGNNSSGNYYATSTITSVSNSPKTCAEIKLRIPCAKYASGTIIYWDAYENDEYADKYVVYVNTSEGFHGEWDTDYSVSYLAEMTFS